MRKSKDIKQRKLMRSRGLMRLIGLISLMGLWACSDDSSEGRGKWVKLELVPYYNIYKVSEEGTRRARNEDLFGSVDGDGPYVPYANLNPQADPSQAAIHVYLTKADEAQPVTEGNFTFHAAEKDDNGNITKQAYWSSGVWMKEGGDYYIYGFMPASAASNASIVPNTDFNNRAILQLNGLDAVTPADVCVVVGVQGLKKADHVGETTTPIAESGITVGNYRYGQPDVTGNYIYLLLDHLYSCLNLEYKVSSEYYKLRTIKLRKVEMVVQGDGATKRNLTITIPGTESAAFNVEDESAGGSSTSAVVFDRTNMTEGTEIPSTSTLNVPGYFTPAVDNQFVIKTTYDVYDRKGNLIRANQKAENTITPEILLGAVQSHTHQRGRMHTLQLTIVPTYLYQLSDGDLDNPMIRVEN